MFTFAPPRTVRIDIFDAKTLQPPAGVILRLANSSSASSDDSNGAIFTFSPSNGPFHTLKLSLIFLPAFIACSRLPSLTFGLSVASSPTPASAEETSASRCIRTLIGEAEQADTETWDEKRYILMSLRSGAVEVKAEGKEVKVANEKGKSLMVTLAFTLRQWLTRQDEQSRPPSVQSTCLPAPAHFPSPTHPSPPPPLSRLPPNLAQSLSSNDQA